MFLWKYPLMLTQVLYCFLVPASFIQYAIYLQYLSCKLPAFFNSFFTRRHLFDIPVKTSLLPIVGRFTWLPPRWRWPDDCGHWTRHWGGSMRCPGTVVLQQICARQNCNEEGRRYHAARTSPQVASRSDAHSRRGNSWGVRFGGMNHIFVISVVI